jgi:hypothetical protein
MDRLLDDLVDNYVEWKLLARRENARANELQVALQEAERQISSLTAEGEQPPPET